MATDRLYFMDNLRTAIILLVVFLHSALSYMMYAPSWWYVINPVTDMFFTKLVVLIDVPIMPAMFFIAGYFAIPSLQRHGSLEFIRGKAWRVLAPWALGIIALAPPTAYFIPYTRGAGKGLFTFWAGEFWGASFQHSVYWFLALLFWMFVVLALLWQIWPALRNITRTPKTAPLWFIPAFFAVSTGLFWGAIQFFPIDGWFVSYFLSFQPVRIFQHILYFSFGILAWKHCWFTAEGYMPRKRAWIPVLIMTTVVYLTVKLGFNVSPEPLWKREFVLACSFSAYCVASLMGWSSIFQAAMNMQGRVARSLSQCSYGIYFLHAPIVYLAAMLFIPVAISIYVKAVLVFAIGAGVSWFLTYFVLRKAPLLRRMF